MNDKILHLFVSLFAVSFAYIKTEDYTKSFKIAITIGFIKEMYDLFTYGLFSLGDMLFNIIGIILGVIMIIISKQIIEIWLRRHNG